jgi:hypothetical protein
VPSFYAKNAKGDEPLKYIIRLMLVFSESLYLILWLSVRLVIEKYMVLGKSQKNEDLENWAKFGQG